MGTIHIVGLGPGDAGLITLTAFRLMKEARCLLLRTAVHPSVSMLDEAHIAYEALDRFYEQGASFENVYQGITGYVLDQAAGGDVVYAVPGSPVVAERTVLMLEKQGAERHIPVVVHPGMSFLEVMYTRLRFDPVNGVTIIDSSDAGQVPRDISTPLIVTQVYDRHVASDLKLSLMDIYGDEYEAQLVYHVSLPDESIQPIKLYELDRCDHIDHLTSLFLPVPPLQSRTGAMTTEGEELPDAEMPFDIDPLVQVMARLRGEHGCPWDKRQTHKTLRRFLIEEVYEMLDAIDQNDIDGIREELGDILYQVVIHARIAEEEGLFSAQDIVNDVTKKMIHRHPHVFTDKPLENRHMSMVNWDRLKQSERRQQHEHLLDGVVKGLPSLLSAYKLQEKSAKKGFEWDTAEQVVAKVHEEWQEFLDAVAEGDRDHMEEEAGDVLFVLANLCRRYDIEPECALHRANNKFRSRFSYVEDCVRASGRDWSDFSLDELDAFWQKAKEEERKDAGTKLDGNDRCNKSKEDLQ